MIDRFNHLGIKPYPEFYKTGDLKWIQRHLDFLSDEKRLIACSEYREIYLKNFPLGRDKANRYLLDFVKEHSLGKSNHQDSKKTDLKSHQRDLNSLGDTSVSNSESKSLGGVTERISNKLYSLKSNNSRKTILGMAGEE